MAETITTTPYGQGRLERDGTLPESLHFDVALLAKHHFRASINQPSLYWKSQPDNAKHFFGQRVHLSQIAAFLSIMGMRR